ncbi:MAG: hemerythrin family protein [Deltaproteobacteria bacterium]
MPPLYPWVPDLETGIARIDEEHREMLALCEALAADRGANAHALGVLDWLKQHIGGHFRAEEEQMAASGFPLASRHKAEHERLAAYMARITRDQEESGPDDDLAWVSNRLLANWLVGHIRNHDRKFASHLHAMF